MPTACPFRLLFALLAAILLAASGCGSQAEPVPAAAAVPYENHPLVGTWVVILPPDLRGDTVVLEASGTARGNGDLLQPMGGTLVRWDIDDYLMPGGLCLEASEVRRFCQGWRLRKDTLGLAASSMTLLRRALPGHDDDSALGAEPGPEWNVESPRLNDTVRGIVP